MKATRKRIHFICVITTYSRSTERPSIVRVCRRFIESDLPLPIARAGMWRDGQMFGTNGLWRHLRLC